MRHTFLVVTVNKWLKSVYICGSYRKIKTGVPLFLDHPVNLKFKFTSLHADIIYAQPRDMINDGCMPWLCMCVYYQHSVILSTLDTHFAAALAKSIYCDSSVTPLTCLPASLLLESLPSFCRTSMRPRISSLACLRLIYQTTFTSLPAFAVVLTLKVPTMTEPYLLSCAESNHGKAKKCDIDHTLNPAEGDTA